VRSRNYLFFFAQWQCSRLLYKWQISCERTSVYQVTPAGTFISCVVVTSAARSVLKRSAQSRFKSHTTATKQQFSLVVVVAAVCTSVIQLPLNRERLWLSGVHSQSTQAKITRNGNDVFHKIWIGQNEWKLPYTDVLTFLLLLFRAVMCAISHTKCLSISSPCGRCSHEIILMLLWGIWCIVGGKQRKFVAVITCCFNCWKSNLVHAKKSSSPFL